jgi:hypothetical protein
MKRRDFITLLSGTAVALPLAARAQQTDGTARIGVLSPLSASETTSAPFEAFRKVLRDLGYIEGKSINFIYRWADGNHERLAEFAADLASSKVDVIFSALRTMSSGRSMSTAAPQPRRTKSASAARPPRCASARRAKPSWSSRRVARAGGFPSRKPATSILRMASSGS